MRSFGWIKLAICGTLGVTHFPRYFGGTCKSRYRRDIWWCLMWYFHEGRLKSLSLIFWCYNADSFASPTLPPWDIGHGAARRGAASKCICATRSFFKHIGSAEESECAFCHCYVLLWNICYATVHDHTLFNVWTQHDGNECVLLKIKWKLHISKQQQLLTKATSSVTESMISLDGLLGSVDE